jgi:hypothetical protein
MSESDFIAIISDMHLAPADEADRFGQHPDDRPARRLQHLQNALDEIISGPPPAAVLFGGDHMNQAVSDPSFLHITNDFMKRFPEPRYAIPGNHDVGSTIGWEGHDPGDMATQCALFRREWQDRWVLETAGFRIMGLNSQISGSILPEANQQSEWLQAELAKQSDLLRVVFFHTPPYLVSEDDDFSDGSEMMCLRPQARRPLLEILHESPPDLLMTAHAHRFWIFNQPRWDWLGIPSTALGQKDQVRVPSHNIPPGDDRVGWIELRRQGDTWRARMRPCGAQ